MALTDSIDLPAEDAPAKEIDPTLVKRIPTGVADLDGIVRGGFPSGSVVLLWGDVGAGAQEFVYTSACKLAMARAQPRVKRWRLGSSCDGAYLPERICYVTFSRSREGVLQELSTSFNPDFFFAFRDLTVFKDFSSTYFKNTVVPSSWTQQESPFETKSTDILEELVNFLDENGRGSMVVVDSLTDLIETETVEMKELVAALKGMQRAAKTWDGIVYLILARGILDKKYEQMIMDSVDGCLVFEWKHYLTSSKRQRYMYVEKFTSVLPRLPEGKIARFPTMVTYNGGLEVFNFERIV